MAQTNRRPWRLNESSRKELGVTLAQALEERPYRLDMCVWIEHDHLIKLGLHLLHTLLTSLITLANQLVDTQLL